MQKLWVRLGFRFEFKIQSNLTNLKKLKLSAMELSKKTPLEIVRKSLFGKELREYIESEKDQVNRIKAKEILIAYEKFKQMYNF